ncbi:MAG: cbb3-type cytochrome oxidase assembly protein CcoS [Bacteroidota bacterium]|nr:cbb3-type cytochrome oxidase assembly protein CcoS [Bacteroidota bacterium]
MSVLFILIGISTLVAAIFLIAFLWSVSNGQYDDDYTPSVRMLFDNEPESKKTTLKEKKTTKKNAV